MTIAAFERSNAQFAGALAVLRCARPEDVDEAVAGAIAAAKAAVRAFPVPARRGTLHSTYSDADIKAFGEIVRRGDPGAIESARASREHQIQDAVRIARSEVAEDQASTGAPVTATSTTVEAAEHQPPAAFVAAPKSSWWTRLWNWAEADA